jgi:prophage maintenance system killer protein
MVWYPWVDDLIDINIMCLDLTGDRHPHKLRGSRKGLQSLLEAMAQEEARGLTYQAAFLMQRIAQIQFFDGANHRTGYVAAKVFLRRNDKRFRVEQWGAAYPFINNIETKTLEDIQKWIEHGTTEESQ